MGQPIPSSPGDASPPPLQLHHSCNGTCPERLPGDVLGTPTADRHHRFVGIEDDPQVIELSEKPEPRTSHTMHFAEVDQVRFVAAAAARDPTTSSNFVSSSIANFRLLRRGAGRLEKSFAFEGFLPLPWPPAQCV